MMNKERYIDITHTPELLRLAEQVRETNQPTVLSRNNEPIAVVTPVGGHGDDIWASYDPERAKAALQASAGALKGVDRDELLADIHDQRGQKPHRRR
jgi:PHD/YefM family antitoxin component YafN of YafNO toxin-antitoxin module